MIRLISGKMFNFKLSRIIDLPRNYLQYSRSISLSSCHWAFQLSDSLVEDDNVDREIESELKKLRLSTLNSECSGRSVFVMQPYIKWGPRKKRDTTPKLQLDEAVALINTLQEWCVSAKETIPLTSFCKMSFFGSGKLVELKNKIIKSRYTSAVFISVDQLSVPQHTFLEDFFELPVYDRYLIIMQIFRDHARSAEAKLQIALAELPYLYSRMSHEYSASLSRIGDSAARISGTTIHTPRDTRKLILHKYEKKLKLSLEKLRNQRCLSRKARKNNDIPVVAVIGYTNNGKTSLVKALTGNEKLIPQNFLFATLDVSFHIGILPCNLKVYFVDTIGFISDIPTHLIIPFEVTLQDAMNADVILHVQDVSHPDWLFQRDRVNETLEKLNIDKKLLNHIIPVANKIDLLNPDEFKIISSEMSQISCANSHGIQDLKLRLEEEVIKATGRMHMVIRAKSGSEECNWLRKKAAVVEVVADPKNSNYSLLSVIITENILDKFKREFINNM